METSEKTKKNKHRGIAMILAMVFIVIFSAISIGFLSLSSANTQIADNHRTSNNALNAALSGLEMVRYWCSTSDPLDGTISKDQLFEPFFNALPTNCPAERVNDPETGALVNINFGSANEPIALSNSASFYADFVSDGADGVIATITGQSGQLTRKLRFRFTYGERPLSYSVFDFGVATKGPLTLKGGTLTAATVRSEADVYIESLDNPKALGVLLNKSEISGVAKIVNPDADITAADIKGKVGGFTGQEAIDQAIEVGVTPTQFPYPDAVHFKQYATGGNYTTGSILTNKIIPAGKGTAKKPLKFTGNTTINGILYVESPNVIDFGGNVTVNGMIIAAGDHEDNSATNKLSFTGSIDSNDSQAPEKGTFLMAPGFALAFTGSFNTINGAIAGNGMTFDGNAGGVIKGSVINYSTTPMSVDGSSDIVFNRSGITDTPSGFVTYRDWTVYPAPESYQENI